MQTNRILSIIGLVLGVVALIISLNNMRSIAQSEEDKDPNVGSGTNPPTPTSPVDVEDLRFSLQEIENDVNVVTDSLQTVNNSLDVIQSFQGQNSDQVELIDDRVTLNSQEIQALEDNAVASGTAFNALQSTLVSVSNLLDTQVTYTGDHGSRLNSLETSSSNNLLLITDNSNEISDLSTDVSSNSGEISTNSSAISANTNAIANIPPQIDYSSILEGATVQTVIVTKKDYQVVSALQGRVTVLGFIPSITLKGNSSRIVVRMNLNIGATDYYWGGFLYKSVNGGSIT